MTTLTPDELYDLSRLTRARLTFLVDVGGLLDEDGRARRRAEIDALYALLMRIDRMKARR
jgi:hypothetical protein